MLSTIQSDAFNYNESWLNRSMNFKVEKEKNYIDRQTNFEKNIEQTDNRLVIFCFLLI